MMTSRRLVPVRSAGEPAEATLIDPFRSRVSWLNVLSRFSPRPEPKTRISPGAWRRMGIHLLFTHSLAALPVGCTISESSGVYSCHSASVGWITDTVLPHCADPRSVTSREACSGESTSWISRRKANRELSNGPGIGERASKTMFSSHHRVMSGGGGGAIAWAMACATTASAGARKPMSRSPPRPRPRRAAPPRPPPPSAPSAARGTRARPASGSSAP